MTLATRIRDKLALEFATELGLGNGSEILCEGPNPPFVDLYVYPVERALGHQWELILPVHIIDGKVDPTTAAGVYVSVGGGEYNHVSDTDIEVPPSIDAVREDMERRVSALELPTLAFEGAETAMFADLRAIMRASKEGDAAALDEAIAAAWEHLRDVVPHLADEIAPEPAQGPRP